MPTKNVIARHLALAVWALAFLAVGSARALDSGGFVALESEDLYHGLSQVRGQPTLVVDGYARLGDGDDIGGSVERVNLPGARGAAAAAIYLGSSRSLTDDWTLGGSLSRYAYSREPSDISYDFTELQARIRWRSALQVDVYYSPDTSMYSTRGTLRNGPSGGAEFGWRRAFAHDVEIDGGIGYRRLGGTINAGYVYADLALAWRIANWQVSVEAVGLDRRARRLFGRPTAGDRWVFGLVRRFGAGT